MKTRTKVILGAVVLLVAAGAVGAKFSNKDRNLPRVTTAKLVRKDLVSRVTCNGKVQARKKVELSAPIAGQILNLAVREGDRVKKGEFLMQIDRVALQASADSSKAALDALFSDRDAARASVERARIEHERNRKSYDSGIIPDLEFQRSRTTLDGAVAQLAAIESRIEQARATFTGASDTLNKTRIVAPMDGIITKLNVEEGEVAVIGTMNNPGTVLMTISDLSVIEAVMEVDETDIPQVHLVQKATILIDAYPDQTFDGEVTEVGSSPINQNASGAEGIDFEVKIRITNPPESLKPGLSVTADIITGSREKVVAVPLQALVLRDTENPDDVPPAEEAEPAAQDRRRATTVAERGRDREGVFVLEDGKAIFKPVTTGITGELDIEAVGGLSDGAEVVTGPFRILRTLKDGDRVMIDKPGEKKQG